MWIYAKSWGDLRFGWRRNLGWCYDPTRTLPSINSTTHRLLDHFSPSQKIEQSRRHRPDSPLRPMPSLSLEEDHPSSLPPPEPSLGLELHQKSLAPSPRVTQTVSSLPALHRPSPSAQVSKMSCSHCLDRVGRNHVTFGALYLRFELFLAPAMVPPRLYSPYCCWVEEEAARPSVAQSTILIRIRRTDSIWLISAADHQLNSQCFMRHL
jgi:hypothetical protein